MLTIITLTRCIFLIMYLFVCYYFLFVCIFVLLTNIIYRRRLQISHWQDNTVLLCLAVGFIAIPTDFSVSL